MGLMCIGPESRKTTNPSTIGDIRNDDTYIWCAQQTSKSKLSQVKSRMVGTRTFGKTKKKKLVAVFRGKKFEFKSRDKSTWNEAVEYGKSVGIPEEQLDFPTN